MLMSKKLIITVAFAAISLAGLNAYAIHKGDVSCDPSWKICVQSAVTDASDTLHFVDSAVIYGQYMDNLPPNPQLLIVDSNSNVVLRAQGQPDLVIGRVSEPVDGDSMYAMSRGLLLNPGFDLNLAVADGAPQTLCNQTAVGFIYERHTYSTKNFTIKILDQNEPVGVITTTVLEQEIAEHSSPLPCRSER